MLTRKNRRTLLLSLLLAITGLAVTGCRSRGGSSAAEPGVMAQVNDYKIMTAELERAYNTQIAGAPQKPAGLQAEALRLHTLDQIIQTRLILQQAEKLGVKTSNDEVEAKLSDAKKPYTVEQFQKRLKDLGLTEDDYKTYISHQLTVQKLMDKEIKPRLSVPDADVNAYYEQNKARLPQPVDEVQIKRQIQDKMRSELEQILQTAYVDQLRDNAEIHNYYVAEVLKNHKPESK